MAYSKGKISIPNVTGNIVITATAVPSAPAHDNLLTMNDGNINKRISGNGTLANMNGYWVSDAFAVNLAFAKKCILKNGAAHVVGARTSGAAYGNCKLVMLDANKTAIATWYMGNTHSASGNIEFIDDGNGNLVCDDLTTKCNTPSAGTKPTDWSTVKYIKLCPAYNNATETITSVSQITSTFEIYVE